MPQKVDSILRAFTRTIDKLERVKNQQRVEIQRRLEQIQALTAENNESGAEAARAETVAVKLRELTTL